MSTLIRINDVQFNLVIQAFNQLVQPVTEPLEEVAGLLESNVEDSFETESSPVTGLTWPLLSENYLAQHLYRQGGKMLQVSAGGLAASYESGFNANSAWIGSNKKYAAIHNFGGEPDMKPGPAGIPAREHVGLSKADEDEILEIFRRFLISP